MAYQLHCPCGETIRDLEPTFVASVTNHLAAAHPGRDYSPEEIMLMAQEIPDRNVDPA